MTPTSDERREVAERLRAQARTVSHDRRYLWQRLEIAVNGWRYGAMVDESYAFDNDVLSRIADLIDPTCEMVVKNGHAYCGKCGHRLAGECEVEEDYYEFRPFCPDCGARVVEG